MPPSLGIGDLLWLTFRKRWMIMAGITTLSVLLSAFHQFFIAKNVYRSEATVMLTGKSGGASPQFGQLASFIGLAQSSGDNMLELVVQSRIFLEKIALKMGLPEKQNGSLGEAVELVDAHLDVVRYLKNSSMIFSWDDESPELAKKNLEIVLEMLEGTMANYDESSKTHQLQFLEQRVRESRAELDEAEARLEAFRRENHGLEIEGQVSAAVGLLQQLRTELQKKRVELEVLQKFVSENDSQVHHLSSEIHELETAVHNLAMGGATAKAGSSDYLKPLTELPSLGTQYTKLLRESQTKQKIYGLLVEQLELSRLEQHKKDGGYKVIDPPSLPIRRILPRRREMISLSALVSLALTFLVCYHLEGYAAGRQGPQEAS